MSSFNGSLTAIGALATVLGLVLYVALASAYRMLQHDGELRLRQLLRRRGVRLEELAGRQVHQAALATRRCVACKNTDECDDWLRSGRRDGVSDFCPNAGFIERMANDR